jgi:hypothetical protein
MIPCSDAGLRLPEHLGAEVGKARRSKSGLCRGNTAR